jgi:hypothetical protein
MTTVPLALDTELTLDLHLVELDLALEAAISTAPELTWSNYFSWTGAVTSWLHLRSLIERVGTTVAWTFVIITRDDAPDTFAQCCGSADLGLAVEFAIGGAARLVVPAGAATVPRICITHPDWPYYAHREELHPVEEAIGLFLACPTGCPNLPGMEYRDPTWRTAELGMREP